MGVLSPPVFELWDFIMEKVFPTYHVFINHRGPDVKKTLASLIYHALTRLGLRVFLDQQELQVGDSLSSSIKTAISSASVHIAIFSETYAESPWCLNELLWMLDCPGSKIIPVFYGIYPKDLRYIDKGAYADAFQNHRDKGRVDITVVERWINALINVSDVTSLVFTNGKDDLGKFLNRIVDRVLENVRMEPLDVAVHPVGLHQAADHFQNEVLNQTELRNQVRVVGIVGLGGSGKSTLVTHLYNTKRSEFKRSCFLSDVSTKKDLPSLQQTLLTDLLGYHNLHVGSTRQGRELIRDRLRGFPRVLIVFDDIDDAEQIENLLLVKDVLGIGSLILVTSRDRDLLGHNQVNILYDMKLLVVKDAQELFCWHAFRQPKPLQDFQDLVKEVVNICGGFPLALKILGRDLSGNHDRNYWMKQVEKFHRQLPDDIFKKVLKISYDSLESDEKEALLDIAHFLVGEDKSKTERILEGLNNRGIDCLETLHQKGLVEFENADVDFYINLQDRKGFERRPHSKFMEKAKPFYIELCSTPKGSLKIRMHDLVRDLVRQIGRQQSTLRLCGSNDEKISTSMHSMPYFVRGIRRDENHWELPLPTFLQRQDICGLKLLALHHSVTDLLQFNGLSGDLIWLRFLKSGLSDIPSRLSLRYLRVLELTGVKFKDLRRLADDFEPPSQLRELTINCIESSSTQIVCSNLLPFSTVADKSSIDSSKERLVKLSLKKESCSYFEEWLENLNLKKLVKIALKNIKGLQSLPIKFEEVLNLRHLDLSGCNDLQALPPSFKELLQLQYLALRDCSNLVIPDLGKICTLEYLDFGGCCLLRQLPTGTVAQRSLRYLNLLHTRIQQLPEHLEQLENLEQLCIGSQLLSSLPSSLNNLCRLTDLILFECSNLCDIGKSIEQLENLERLRICKSGMSTLPEGIAWMNIKVMDIRHCPIKSDFKLGGDTDEMPLQSLQNQKGCELGADGARELAMTASRRSPVSCLTNLIITHSFISKLYIPAVKSLFPNLQIVDLSNNQRLIEIEGLPGSLIRLDLMDCEALKTLACLSHLTSLRFLNISGCGELETLNVEGLNSIEVIKAYKCWKLHNIQGLRQLQKLSYIHISTGNSVSISTWRHIMNFPSSISTAILCGATVNRNIDEMDRFVHSYQQVRVTGIPRLPLGYSLSVKLDDASLEGAIMLCIIAYNFCEFEVKLVGHVYNTSRTINDRNTYRAHLFIWTKDSEVFKEMNFCNEEAVYCKIKRLHPGVIKGWMVTARNIESIKVFLTSLLLSNTFM